MIEPVLVTGASGGLGRRLLAQLRSDGIRTRAMIHRRDDVEADERVTADLLDPASLEAALEGATAVVHLAAVTHARSRAAYAAVNVAGTRNLCVAATAQGVRRFVHVSTRVIDPRGGWYSASKAAAEQAVRSLTIDWVVVRLSEVYGSGGREGIDGVIRRGLSGRWIPVVGDGDDVLRPVHADDVVQALVAALRIPTAACKTYTLVGSSLTTAELAATAAAAGGNRSRIVRIPVPVMAAACLLARRLPLPVYPDQLARLRVPKAPPTPDADAAELGFSARPLDVQSLL